jgi:quercetin dioxygenase-like cupin family protein
MKNSPITSSTKWMRFNVIVPCVAMAFSGAGITPPSSKPAQDKTVLSRSLPRLNGADLRVTVVEVTYGPGESSPPHTHPCPVIGYVVEGALRTKVKGETEAVYKVGESFYEAPHGIHAISANASPSKSARFLAFFVCEDDTPLSVPPPPPATTGAQQESIHE